MHTSFIVSVQQAAYEGLTFVICDKEMGSWTCFLIPGTGLKRQKEFCKHNRGNNPQTLGEELSGPS